MCPVLCSGQGDYSGGECVCRPGWKGKECNVRWVSRCVTCHVSRVTCLVQVRGVRGPGLQRTRTLRGRQVCLYEGENIVQLKNICAATKNICRVTKARGARSPTARTPTARATASAWRAAACAGAAGWARSARRWTPRRARAPTPRPRPSFGSRSRSAASSAASTAGVRT